jgi:hypothetical protein
MKNWSRLCKLPEQTKKKMSILRCLNVFSEEAEAKEEEEADNICFVDLWEQIKAVEERVKVEGMHIQQVKLESDEENMGDHYDLPNCRKFLQLGRLQKQDQPLEPLDAVMKEISRLMIRSARSASEEGLSKKKEAAQQQKQQQGDGADEQLQRMIWDPGGFQQLRWEAHEKELMIL